MFADAKEKHSMRFTYLRGLARVTNWVRLKFAAMNLKSMQFTSGYAPSIPLLCAFSHLIITVLFSELFNAKPLLFLAVKMGFSTD